jgi:glycosyltransferase involved in cell wall biosynthesis
MKKVLIITYYWPPSGGSGVQRWMYFCKYLKEFGIHPVVITVDEHYASYRHNDDSFNELTKEIEVHKTRTREPLKLYSRIVSGHEQSGIPAGFAGESKTSLFQKISRAIRGNLFIPDARIGWIPYALQKAREILSSEKINLVITSGPPHSTHLAALKLKSEFDFTWIADFRDPWTDLYYNRLLYRTKWAMDKDSSLERKTLQSADVVLTIGPSMKQHLIGKGKIDPEKVVYIYSGFDTNDFINVEDQTNPEYFTISHIGVLSDSQPITPFLLALAGFYKRNHPICKRLKLRLIGNVSPKIIEEVHRVLPDLTLENFGYVPKKEAISFMLSSDLLFNSMPEMENSELMVTGKLMEYIAAGKPVLCLGNPNGDAAHLLKEFEGSEVFDRKRVDLITLFLDRAFDNWTNNVQFHVNQEKILQWSRYNTTHQLADLLNKYL